MSSTNAARGRQLLGHLKNMSHQIQYSPQVLLTAWPHYIWPMQRTPSGAGSYDGLSPSTPQLEALAGHYNNFQARVLTLQASCINRRVHWVACNGVATSEHLLVFACSLRQALVAQLSTACLWAMVLWDAICQHVPRSWTAHCHANMGRYMRLYSWKMMPCMCHMPFAWCRHKA